MVATPQVQMPPPKPQAPAVPQPQVAPQPQATPQPQVEAMQQSHQETVQAQANGSSNQTSQHEAADSGKSILKLSFNIAQFEVTLAISDTASVNLLVLSIMKVFIALRIRHIIFCMEMCLQVMYNFVFKCVL